MKNVLVTLIVLLSISSSSFASIDFPEGKFVCTLGEGANETYVSKEEITITRVGLGSESGVVASLPLVEFSGPNGHSLVLGNVHISKNVSPERLQDGAANYIEFTDGTLGFTKTLYFEGNNLLRTSSNHTCRRQ